MTTETETVNHPQHYNQHPAGIECITIVEHAPFNIGNAIKYLWRATWGKKQGADPIEDLRKAIWYIEAEIKRLSKERWRAEDEQLERSYRNTPAPVEYVKAEWTDNNLRALFKDE
jgi:hypothetical protein